MSYLNLITMPKIQELQQKTTNHTKCGEVYYLVPSIFHIYCTECGQKILFQQFLQHYRLQHLTQCEDSIVIEPMKIKQLHEISEVGSEFEEDDEEQDDNYYDEGNEVFNGQDGTNYAEITDIMATCNDSEFLEEAQEEYLTIEQITFETYDELIQNTEQAEDEIKISNEDYVCAEKTTTIQNECKSFKCQICHRQLKSKYILANHMRVVHAEKLQIPDTRISCRFCNASCESRFDLLVHKRKFHADRYASSQYGSVKATVLEDETLRPVPCSLCERRFRNESSLAIHMRVHKGKQKEDIIKLKVIKTVVCEICGKICRSRRHLERHQKHYHGSSNCDVCKKEFKQPIDAHRHRSLHFKPKKFKCVHCEISCYSTGGLQKHSRIHKPKEHKEYTIDRRKQTTSTRRNICEICGKDFRSSYQLNSHIQRHNNERPFKCDNCEKSFYSRQLLRLHCVTHSSDRPYACDICGATFQYKRALRVHSDLHTGFRNFKCLHCDKAYVDGGRLKTHIRLVHGVNLASTTTIVKDASKDLNKQPNIVNDQNEVEAATKSLEKHTHEE